MPSRRSIIKFVLVIFVSTITGTVCAGPLTLEFDARVSEVYKSSPDIDLPVSVVPGDLIHGEFTFEPGPPGVSYIQNLGMVLSFNGLILRTQTFQMSTMLNEYPSPNKLNSGLGQPSDSIYVGCSLLNNVPQCNPNVIPGATELTWGSFLSLSGDSPLLPDYNVPSDPHVWDQFTARSLELTFTPISSLALLRIDATVGVLSADVSTTPEPSASMLALVANLCCVAMRTTRAKSPI